MNRSHFDPERAADYPEIGDLDFENSPESPDGGLLQNLPHDRDDDERWLRCEPASPFFYDGD